jgi:hypothetical protein
MFAEAVADIPGVEGGVDKLSLIFRCTTPNSPSVDLVRVAKV